MTRLTQTNCIWGLLGIGALLALANCSSSNDKTTGSPGSATQGNNPASSGANASGSGGGTLGGGGGSNVSGSSGGSSGSTMTSSGSGGSNTGSGSGTKSGSSGGSSGSNTGSSGGSSTSGDGGTSSGMTASSGGGDASVALGMCKPADTTPCSSYGTPNEQGGYNMLQLGPYGAQMDVNVGTGYANDVQSSDQPPQPSSTCQSFAGLFGEPQNITDQLLQTTMNGVTIDFSLYSAYHPANWPSTPVPVITWGNGTCAQPEGYGGLLRYIASYGYFVIAPNSRQVASTNSDGTHVMMKALDYATAANKDPMSPYYGKLDLSKVGASGHSQGGGETITVCNMDSRIQYCLPFNGGDTGVQKPYLAVSGDMDVTGATVQSMTSDINGASVPAAWLYYHNPVGMGSLRGHLVLMLTPERVSDQAVSWFEMWFRSDAASKAKFVGSSCGFCGQTSDMTNAYDYGHNSMLQ